MTDKPGVELKSRYQYLRLIKNDGKLYGVLDVPKEEGQTGQDTYAFKINAALEVLIKTENLQTTTAREFFDHFKRDMAPANITLPDGNRTPAHYETWQSSQGEWHSVARYAFDPDVMMQGGFADFRPKSVSRLLNHKLHNGPNGEPAIEEYIFLDGPLLSRREFWENGQLNDPPPVKGERPLFAVEIRDYSGGFGYNLIEASYTKDKLNFDRGTALNNPKHPVAADRAATARAVAARGGRS